MIYGDSLEYMKMMDDNSVDFVLADPPYGQHQLINESIQLARNVSRGPSFYFMYPEDVWHLDSEPCQIIHWVKQPSTKNTVRKYSRFVEAIVCYDLACSPFNQTTHWSARTGVFTDTFADKQVHPFEKPSGLIEKILMVNTNPGDLILDPFAGSGSVEKVCKRIDRKCLSIEIT
jgi:DNA modification methylase